MTLLHFTTKGGFFSPVRAYVETEDICQMLKEAIDRHELAAAKYEAEGNLQLAQDRRIAAKWLRAHNADFANAVLKAFGRR